LRTIASACAADDCFGLRIGHGNLLLGLGFADSLFVALLPELHTLDHRVELGAVLEAGRLAVRQHDPHHLNDRLGQPVTRPLARRRRLADIAVPIPEIVAD
jgi:hypothetical protein